MLQGVQVQSGTSTPKHLPMSTQGQRQAGTQGVVFSQPKLMLPDFRTSLSSTQCRRTSPVPRASNEVSELSLVNPTCSPGMSNPACLARAGSDDFMSLHGTAIQLMRKAEDLGKAYQYFQRANNAHQRATGKPSPEALYNSACCLSLAAEAGVKGNPRSQARGGAGHIAPEMPPYPEMQAPTSPKAVADKRFDLAFASLASASNALLSSAHSCNGRLAACAQWRGSLLNK